MKHFFHVWTLLFITLILILPSQVNALAIGQINLVTPQGSCGKNEVETALGCISTLADAGPNSFFASIIKIAVALGGGLALVLMLYGVFIVTTSAGIPDKLKEGQEIITSAISGLIFIILSVFLLNFIGINILSLPGLQ